MQRTLRAQNLIAVADAFASGDRAHAVEIAKLSFPWSPSLAARAAVVKRRALAVFRRDCFTDRYSGSKLVFPGALLACGLLLPEAFPMHPTWKVSLSHEIFWELWPVVDHIVPVTRCGSNELTNMATTSVVNNTAKGTALLAELGWELLPQPTSQTPWDGMMKWFLRVVQENPALLEHSQLRGWHEAATKGAA